MPDVIIFNTIAANGMETNAAIFVGDNSAGGWDSHNKNQASIQFVFGAFNTFPANVNIVNDPDFIDTPITDQDIEGSTSV